MTILDIGFQIITENTTDILDEKVRILENVAPSWTFVVIFSAILGLVLIKQFAPKRLKVITSMLYQSSDIEKMTREWNPLTSVSGFIIAVSYIALVSLFIQKSILICSGNSILYGGSDFYVETCIFTSAYILVQYLIINVIGWLFNTQVASQHQAITHLSMATTLSLIFSMLLLIMAFYPIKLCAIAGLVIIMIFTSIRLTKTFAEFQFLIKGETLNIFLYLCTLEIIPFAVALTMVIRMIATGSVL